MELVAGLAREGAGRRACAVVSGRWSGGKALATEARISLKHPSPRDHQGLQSLRAAPFSIVVNPERATDAKHRNMPRWFRYEPGEWARCDAVPY